VLFTPLKLQILYGLKCNSNQKTAAADEITIKILNFAVLAVDCLKKI
jgi:hypothetical protein